MTDFTDEQLEKIKKLIDYEADGLKTFFRLSQDAGDNSYMRDYAHSYNTLVNLREKIDLSYLNDDNNAAYQDAVDKIFIKGVTYN